MRSARPCLPSPTSACLCASVLPKYVHCRLGQAKPSVGIRFGAPRQLFTSHQGRTGAGTGPAPNQPVEACRQTGQSSGERGLSRRWSVVRTEASALDCTRPGWGKPWAPEPRQREDEQDHEQVHMQVHEESSWLEMRQRDRFLQRRKNTGPQAGKSSG